MASELDTAFGNFEKMPDEQRRQMDKTLSFLEIATTATAQGARNRELMREQGVSPDALKAMAAYRAYKYKMKHEGMGSRDKALMRLQGVPDQEIERLGSRAKWEADTIGHYDKLSAMTRPTFEMSPETIVGDEQQKKQKRQPKQAQTPAVMPQPAAAPPPTQGAPAQAAPAAAPMPVAAPGQIGPGPAGAPMFDAPLAPGPSPQMTIGGQQLAEAERKRLPLALALNGGM